MIEPDLRPSFGHHAVVPPLRASTQRTLVVGRGSLAGTNRRRSCSPSIPLRGDPTTLTSHPTSESVGKSNGYAANVGNVRFSAPRETISENRQEGYGLNDNSPVGTVGVSQNQPPTFVNVSPRLVESVSKVLKGGTPALGSAVEQGETTVSLAAKLAAVRILHRPPFLGNRPFSLSLSPLPPIKKEMEKDSERRPFYAQR